MALIYENGWRSVVKDTKKYLKYIEEASNYNYPDAMIKLAQCCKEGKITEQDYEKSASLYFNVFKKFFNNSSQLSSCEKNFLEILHEKKIFWTTEYHPYWNGKKNLNSQIVSLLLISKYRKESLCNSSFLVKGIAFKIIQHLCHFQQKNPSLY